MAAVWWRRCGGAQAASDACYFGGVAVGIAEHLSRYVVGPQHGEVGCAHLVFCRQVEPDLKQFQRVGLIAV